MIVEDGGQNFKLRLIDGRASDGRTHNLPTAHEFAALIPGYFVMNMEKRDIIVETKTGRLQRINELHPSYLPLQYPLLFPYGDDGFRLDIPIGFQNTSGRKWKSVTMREYFAYRILARDGESPTITRSGRLFQQFLVSAYTMIESNRLCYVWFNQKKLHCNDFESIKKTSETGVETLSEQGQMISRAVRNHLVDDELRYNQEEQRKEQQRLLSMITDEQRAVYEEILDVVIHDKEGGRTAHSRFNIPINPDESTSCKNLPDSDLAKLLRLADLIVWDKAPMMSRHCFENLDRTLCDIFRTKEHKSFGGKVIVFGGDFRQILPVIPYGGRTETVTASLKKSYISEHCKVLRLTRNMRLLSGRTEKESEELRLFSEWILAVRDGNINNPNDGIVDINIQEDLIKECEDPISTIVKEEGSDQFIVRAVKNVSELFDPPVVEAVHAKYKSTDLLSLHLLFFSLSDFIFSIIVLLCSSSSAHRFLHCSPYSLHRLDFESDSSHMRHAGRSTTTTWRQGEVEVVVRRRTQERRRSSSRSGRSWRRGGFMGKTTSTWR
ncbi:hypothetical protein Bca4012_065157 [Brassica carinata]